MRLEYSKADIVPQRQDSTIDAIQRHVCLKLDELAASKDCSKSAFDAILQAIKSY